MRWPMLHSWGSCRQRPYRRVCMIVAIVLAVIFAAGCAVLIYLFSEAGLRLAVRYVNDELQGVVRIEYNAEGGHASLARGLDVGQFRVLVPEVLDISADHLRVDYDLWDSLCTRSLTLIISELSAVNLQIRLAAGSVQPDAAEEPPAEEGQDFKLNLPFNIVISAIELQDFRYLSEIVDVAVSHFGGRISYVSNQACLYDGVVEDIDVHLKSDSTEDAGQSSAVSAADDAADSAGAAEDGQAQYPQSSALEEEEDETGPAAAALQPPPDSAASIEELPGRTGDPGVGTDAAEPDKRLQEADAAESADDPGVRQYLPTIILPLDVSVEKLRIKRARYRMAGFDLLNQAFDADLRNIAWHEARLDIGSLTGVHPLFELRVSGHLIFTQMYGLGLEVGLRGSDSQLAREVWDGVFYRQDLDFTAQGDLSELHLDLTAGAERGETSAELDIRFSPLYFKTQPLEIKGLIPNFAFPLAAEHKMFAITDSEITVAGVLGEEVSFDIRTLFSGYGFENFEIKSAGLTNLQRTCVDTLLVNGVYEGAELRLSSTARIGYAGGLDIADGKLDLGLSDGAFISSYLQGPLALQIGQLQVHVDEEGHFAGEVQGLDGLLHMNDQQAKLEAQIVRIDAQQHLEAEKLAFSLGKGNTLRVSGHSGSERGLTAQLNFGSLQDLVTDLRGNLTLNALFKGTLEEFATQLRGGSRVLKMGDFEVHGLVYDAAFSSSDLSFRTVTTVDTVRLSRALQASRDCAFSLEGSMQEHELIFICAGVNSATVEFTGGLDHDTHTYQSLLSKLSFENQYSGSLDLQEHVAFVYDLEQQSGSLSALTLSGELGTIAVGHTDFSVGRDIDTAISIDGFNLSSLDQFLASSGGFDGQGIINLDLRLKASLPGEISSLSDLDAALSAVAHFSGTDLLIPAGDMRLAFDSLDFWAEVSRQQVKADLEVQLSEYAGTLDVDLLLTDPLEQRDLSGSIRLDNLDLALFADAGAGAINAITGTANIDTQVRGSLQQVDMEHLPQLFGDITLHGSLDPRVHVGAIENFDLVLRANGTQGGIDGQLGINGGKLDLGGKLDWSSGPHGRLEISTAQLPLFLLGYGTARVDLDTAVSFTESLAAVTGKIAIPSARIRVSSVESGAHMPSDDEEIVGSGGLAEHEERMAEQSSFATVLDLDFSLGEDVEFAAYGLNTNIRGGLQITKEQTAADINAQGEIYLERGTASVMGRNYILNKAVSRFKGNIANPSLDVEVVADPDDLDDDVEVGVRVRGYAAKPDLQFFSKPQMSDNEIYSYLVYGYGLEKSSDQSANNSSMMIGMGLSSATGLINSFTGALGLSGVRVKSQGTGDESQVAVQGYVTRRVMLSYGYGVFNSIGEFKLRYELLRKLYVQFASSLDQAVDLIYSFEFN